MWFRTTYRVLSTFVDPFDQITLEYELIEQAAPVVVPTAKIDYPETHLKVYYRDNYCRQVGFIRWCFSCLLDENSHNCLFCKSYFIGLLDALAVIGLVIAIYIMFHTFTDLCDMYVEEKQRQKKKLQGKSNRKESSKEGPKKKKKKFNYIPRA